MLVPHRSQFDWTFLHPSSIAFPLAGLNSSRFFPRQSQTMALLCPSPASTPGLCLKCIALSHTDFDCTLPRRSQFKGDCFTGLIEPCHVALLLTGLEKWR